MDSPILGSDGSLNKVLVPMTLKQNNEFLLKTHKFSDVTFVVLPTKEDEETTRFPAHRVIVSARSRVFENMFYGPDRVEHKGDDDLEVEVGDGVTNEAFSILLCYVYTDNTLELTENNVMSVLYCSKKYELDGLRQECIKAAQAMVKKDSKKCILTFLKDSQILEEYELVQTCLSLISSNSHDLLVDNHDQFLNLTSAAVIAICKLDILAISEFELFQLISDWAVAEGQREQMDVTNINSLRFVLLNVLPNIRFPCMEHEKLAMEVRNSGLLAPEELTDLFAHCLSHGKLETKYPSKPRQAPHIRTPGGTNTTPKYTSTPSPHTTTSSNPKEVPRYMLTQKQSRHSSMTKSTSRSLTDSHKASLDSNSHKNSHDGGSHKNSHDGSSQEGLPKIDGEPGGDLNTTRVQQEGDVFNKDGVPLSAPRRARSVVPTANKPRQSH